MKPTREAMQAVEFTDGQIWDAVAGLWAAYQVDSGDTSTPGLPYWKDLNEVQQGVFSLLSSDPLLAIHLAMLKVASLGDG